VNSLLRPNSLVHKVIYDDQTGRAAGVEVIDTVTHETLDFHSSILFLNASAIATAAILLNSTSLRFPNGMGNDSDQLGRNLMDHHKCHDLSGMIDDTKNPYNFGRKIGRIYVPRFRNVQQQRKDYIRGFNYKGLSRRTVWGKEGPTTGPWILEFTGFGESLPYADNRITLNTDVKDKYGCNTVSINASYQKNENVMNRDMASAMKEMLEMAGLKDIQGNARMSSPGNSNHEMGTARMGLDPKTSVLNAFNQMHDVRNVFITDGACMTSASCVGPSLTYMVLTARACSYAVDELKKMNI
jgi:choline dehydrogenase-like flavoprotein